MQNVCKEGGCANNVQTKVAPKSVQTLCKEFGPPWRVSGPWLVPAIAGRQKEGPGTQNAPAIVFVGGHGHRQARPESIHRQAGLLTAHPQTHFPVGDEVTRLKFLRFLEGKLDPPYVGSYFFNGRLTQHPQ